MSLSLKTLAALCVSVGLAAAASAGPVTAAFTYTPGAPAKQIYADFKAAAAQACQSNHRSIAVRMKEEALCSADLLDQAVAALGSQQVAALHRGVSRPAALAQLQNQ